jgi:hypothetical protein
MKSDLLTKDERLVVDKLVEAWDAFIKLDQLHPDHVNEFRSIIHSAQYMIMARPVIDELQ